jgi:hypothetical protein
MVADQGNHLLDLLNHIHQCGFSTNLLEAPTRQGPLYCKE